MGPADSMALLAALVDGTLPFPLRMRHPEAKHTPPILFPASVEVDSSRGSSRVVASVT